MHLANAGPRVKGPIFFNVDKPVGQGPGVETGFGLSEDVQLVQHFLRLLGYYKMAGSPGCSGHNDDDTIQAIIQFQLNHTSIKPDGRISVAHGTTFAAQSPFAIVTLNRVVREKYRTEWPRIHRIGGQPAPPLLWNRIIQILGDVSA